MLYIDNLVKSKVKQIADHSIVSLSELNVKQQIQIARSKALGHVRSESAADVTKLTAQECAASTDVSHITPVLPKTLSPEKVVISESKHDDEAVSTTGYASDKLAPSADEIITLDLNAVKQNLLSRQCSALLGRLLMK